MLNTLIVVFMENSKLGPYHRLRTVSYDARGVRAYARNPEQHPETTLTAVSRVPEHHTHSRHVYYYVASKDGSIQVNGDIGNLQVG